MPARPFSAGQGLRPTFGAAVIDADIADARHRDKKIALAVQGQRAIGRAGARHAIDDDVRRRGGDKFVAGEGKAIDRCRRAGIELALPEPDAGAAIDAAEMLGAVGFVACVQMQGDNPVILAARGNIQRVPVAEREMAHAFQAIGDDAGMKARRQDQAIGLVRQGGR